MTLRKRTALIVISVMFVLCALFLFAGCGGDGDKGELVVENYRVNFKVGDEFTVGDEFKAYAVLPDGTRKDVTDDVVIRKEKGFDMNVAGDYMITVEYGELKTIYTVYVDDADNVLTSISVDASGAVTTYKLGDEVSFDGLNITATYMDSQNNPVVRNYTGVADFDFEIICPDGTKSDVLLSELGEHTVKIMSGDVSAEYKIQVSGVNLSTVSSSIGVAEYGERNVNGGEAEIYEFTKEGRSTDYTYTFGDNYTYYKESYSSTVGSYEHEYHISLDGSRVFVVELVDGSITPSSPTSNDAMNGIPVNLWYYDEQAFGVVDVIENIYNIGKDDPNRDYTESVDEAARHYSFSFGYKFPSDGNARNYYFVNSVDYTLDEEYFVKTATVSQKLYTTNHTTGADGITTIVGSKDGYSYEMRVQFTQQKGERNAVNPYSADAMRIASYDLMYNGKALADGDVITGQVTVSSSGIYTSSVALSISNVMPKTADIEADLPQMTDGLLKAESRMFSGTGYSAINPREDKNTITITFMNGGVWDFIIKTQKTEKRIKIKITGVAPTQLTSQVYNTATSSFVSVRERNVLLGAQLLFRALPNQYANDAVNASLTVGDTNSATVEHATVNGVDCWKFTATAVGTYTVTMTSTADAKIKCTLTVTVVDVPDFQEMLSGKYMATDTARNVYYFEFENNGDTEVITGNLKVTMTDVAGKSVEQTFEFTAQSDSLEIALNPVSGEELGISLEINSVGQLVMRDRYEDAYEVTKAR